MKSSLSSYRELCKIRIALLSSLSAATGFLLAATELRSEMIILVLGVFLMACGSSALNQYQERETDAAMPRTSNRPLPSGRIKPVNALYFSLSLLFSGSSTLLLTGALPAPLLGLFAVAWYNGVYTSLKRKTAFAVVPGALIGAIPPAMGWIAGGGAMGDTKLLMICFFFFIWQVPHSWLFIMHYGQEYEMAGLPTLTKIFSPLQMKRIIFNWIFATTISCLFLSAMGMVHYFFIHMALLFLSSWLIWNGIKPLLRQNAEYVSVPFFKKTNYYLLLVMLLLSADKLFMK
jgi:protoheme IX farnesyltransferase